MKSFSITSLFFSYALLTGCLSLLLMAFLKKTKNESLQLLAFACLIQFFIYTTLILRPNIPVWVGIHIPNFLSVYYLYFFYKAVKVPTLNKTQSIIKIFSNGFIFIIAFLYSLAIYFLNNSPYATFIPVLVGAVLTVGNLVIANEILQVHKKTPNIFVKISFFLSIIISLLWVVRGIAGYFFEIVLAQDQNLVNVILFSVLLTFIFIRKITWIGFYLDSSIQYQERLEKFNSTILELVEEVKGVEIVAQGMESGMVNVLNQLSKERDNETGNHILRTQLFVRLIASHLDDIGKSDINYTQASLNTLFQAAPLHDIGKVGIPDSILLKNGKLEGTEWEIMKTHTLIGERILSSMNIDGQINSDIIKVAIEIAGSHHENWDGTGYPRGLKGKEIPQSARIMALADVYDALLSKRPYKKAWTYKATSEYITSLSGTKFDPDVVDAFLVLKDEFRLIRKQFQED